MEHLDSPPIILLWVLALVMVGPAVFDPLRTSARSRYQRLEHGLLAAHTVRLALQGNVFAGVGERPPELGRFQASMLTRGAHWRRCLIRCSVAAIGLTHAPSVVARATHAPSPLRVAPRRQSSLVWRRQ